jgi:hypothetical protein
VAAVAGTLIVDEEGSYDPNHYNDIMRLLRKCSSALLRVPLSAEDASAGGRILIAGSHPGYITAEQFEANRAQFPGRTPLLLEVRSEIEVSHAGAQRELGLDVRGAGEETFAAVDDLEDEGDRSLAEGHQVDRGSRRRNDVGTEPQALVELEGRDRDDRQVDVPDLLAPGVE